MRRSLTSGFASAFATLSSDIVALATAHHLPAVTVTTMPELRQALTTPGPCVIHVTTDRTTNLDVHRQLNTAVATALSPDDDEA